MKEKFYDVVKIGSGVRSINEVSTRNSVFVDGPFRTYQGAAEAADRMNANVKADAGSPRYVAVVRS